MHSYKSLIAVACMGGVMVLMAGVLLYSNDLPDPQAGKAKSPMMNLKGNFTRLRGGGSLGSTAPDKGLLKNDLDVLRVAMKSNGNSFTNSNPLVKRALAHGRAVVRASDFSLLESELSQRGISASYKSVLIVFLGASKAEKGVPILESYYSDHPTRVIEALRLNSTAPALAAFQRLYVKSTNARERFCFIQSLRKLPPEFACSFIEDRLSHEIDLVSLKDSINMTRFVQDVRVVFALNNFVLANDERSKGLMRFACNALAAQARIGGADALFDLHLNRANSAEVQDAAGNAIAFMKAPDQVQNLLSRVAEVPNPSASVGRFFFRNAAEADLVALESFLKADHGSRWRSCLKVTLDRLRQ
ncbi:MAG: hypothetical protein ACI97A_001638 [Planctomycetota bacterium]|jgi:hypothetical protein